MKNAMLCSVKFIVGFIFLSNSLLAQYDMHYFDINKLKLPIDNRGSIASVWLTPYPSYGVFDDKIFLFSGGFYLSGYTNDSLWGNGYLASSLIQDYVFGTVSSNLNSKIYIVKSNSIPFGSEWVSWINAVNLGASFYDGDNDGIYNPIDLNGNGIWDINEDRPDFLSDRTAWCVFNDGMPDSMRRYRNVTPQGIEIRQTMFASGDENSEANNIIFIRYRLTNSGIISDRFDSVYFSVALDPDIGNEMDDLVGCDTVLNVGFAYQTEPDLVYGTNPPAVLAMLLQGPQTYIPGETFIDINGNGVYDNDIDIPLDTAYSKKGPYLGVDEFPGAKNLQMTSFTQYIFMSMGVIQRDPASVQELRHYMLGGLRDNGEPIDVCFWPFGNGATLVDCAEINPKFMYSGDPNSGSGWLNIFPVDQRMMLNTGPFVLEINKPIDIITTYIVARGSNPIESVMIVKKLALAAKKYYDVNFADLPVSIDEKPLVMPSSYKLYQNYPNPFNPSTTIGYKVMNEGFISIKIYDILGNEVKTLVNEIKSPGAYNVNWEGDNNLGEKLTSGVYFYHMQAGNYSSSKKMIIQK
jgi:hypothetical protein